MKSYLTILIMTATLCNISFFSFAADASDLKSLMLMPGPLTQAHAKEEKQCNSCHSDFDKSAQNALCLDCHKPIAADLKKQTGFHGRTPSLSESKCKSCHTDHEGRDFNIVPLDQDTFDHNNTDFSLKGKHKVLNCNSCHKENTLFREAPGKCYDCHQEQDTHRKSLGKDCGSCHQPEGWHQRKSFDHESTKFSLQGSHQKLECSSCHAGEQYTFEDSSCISCHRVKDVHLGNYGKSCDRCHSQNDWKSLAFDHSAETDFPLTGSHKQQACQTCHFNGLVDNSPSMQCVDCHRSTDIHAGRYGEKCSSCHNTTRWTQARFDHASKTNWPLTGAHQKISCLQCHRGSLEESLNTDCQSCHSGDNVHHSEQLSQCSNCHQTDSWKQTTAFDHELTSLPLEGMHASAPCQSCHNDLEFHQAESQCISCHQQDDMHKGTMGKKCDQCHSPNGWTLWSFDHDKNTDFLLAGAHKNLSCDSCHKGSNPNDVAGNCAGCHRSDDRHNGSFGLNCGRCHSSDSFGDVQWKK